MSWFFPRGHGILRCSGHPGSHEGSLQGADGIDEAEGKELPVRAGRAVVVAENGIDEAVDGEGGETWRADEVTPEILKRTRSHARTREWYRAGPSAEKFMQRLGDETVRGAGRQWDAIWDDGDFFKSGLNTQGIYVSPDRDLVIVYFAVEPTQQFQKYLRPLATSGLFENRPD